LPSLALRHPCYSTDPRHPYLPKRAKGAGSDGQPLRWSADDQARRHAEEDTDRHLSVNARAPISEIRSPSTHRYRCYVRQVRDRRAARWPVNTAAIHAQCVRGASEATIDEQAPVWLWPFLMNKPPSRSAGILVSVCAVSFDHDRAPPAKPRCLQKTAASVEACRPNGSACLVVS